MKLRICLKCKEPKVVENTSVAIHCKRCSNSLKKSGTGRYKDITGFRSGLLTAISISSVNGYFWKCICDCGGTIDVKGQRFAQVKSCGCLRHTNNGLSKTRTYSSWISMIGRCFVESSLSYQNYGGRGITVCDRWRNSCLNFLADMGERPDNATLDRIDNNGDYELSNCRWATRKDQALNRRTNRYIQAFNKSMTISEWADEFGIKFNTLYGRISSGWDIELALTKPIKIVKFNNK